MRNTTVGDFLFQYLYEKGVRHVFGVPGDFALPMFKALEASKLDIITMTHEPSVGFAADAYARVNGLGVACVTYGVGGLNMVNSVACAYAEKSPILVISGAPSLKDRNSGLLMHHEVRDFDSQYKIYQEFTCASAVILDNQTAYSDIARVVDEVLYQSKPGYLEIGYDVINLLFKESDILLNHHQTASQKSLEQAVQKASLAINSAKKPVILAGVEVLRQHLSEKYYT